MLNFAAEAIEIEENDLDVLMIGFFTEENYLMIQQSNDVDDAEYHIERDDQSFGGYGGVEKITLSTNSLEVDLNEVGQETLQCEGVKVDFETDDETFELLAEKLKYIFGDILTIK